MIVTIKTRKVITKEYVGEDGAVLVVVTTKVYKHQPRFAESIKNTDVRAKLGLDV